MSDLVYAYQQAFDPNVKGNASPIIGISSAVPGAAGTVVTQPVYQQVKVPVAVPTIDWTKTILISGGLFTVYYFFLRGKKI